MCEGKEVEVKEIRHRLPCALVAGTRMRIFETAKANAAADGLDVLKCVDLRIDTYLNKPKLALQDKWNFSRYTSYDKTPSISYNTRKNPQPTQLKNRLLLFAETQIGKTGAFTHFLLECVQETAVFIYTGGLQPGCHSPAHFVCLRPSALQSRHRPM